MHGTYCIKILVSICFRSSKQLFWWIPQLLCWLFSVRVECYIPFGSPSLSPTSSLKCFICANSPIFIMPDFVNTTLEYGAGRVKWVQWLATGWMVRGSNSGRGNRGIDVLLLKIVQTMAGAHHPPVQQVLGFISRREAACSTWRWSKNEWSYIYSYFWNSTLYWF